MDTHKFNPIPRFTLKKRLRRRWKYSIDYLLLRKYYYKNRTNLGKNVREKAIFFEKPLLRLIYLTNFYTISIAARRNSVYFTDHDFPTSDVSDYRDAVGRWTIRLFLHEKFTTKFYYRH